LDYARGEYDKYVKMYGPDSPLAQSYAELIKSYEAQLKSYDKALESKEWGEILGEGVDPREFETYVELLEAAHPEMRQLYKDTETYEKALLSVATANKKMEKGVKTLSSNWDNWNEIMGDSTSSAEDIATVLPGINDALQDVLNLDTE
jgi:hypothetical protein